MGGLSVLPFRDNRDRLCSLPMGRRTKLLNRQFTAARQNQCCSANCAYVGNRNVNPTRGPQPCGPFFGAAAQ